MNKLNTIEIQGLTVNLANSMMSIRWAWLADYLETGYTWDDVETIKKGTN